MAEETTHEQLAAAFHDGEFHKLYPVALGYVALTIGRMLSRGRLVVGQIDDDLRQTAHLAAVEACHNWDPLQSLLGSWAEIKIRSAIQDELRFSSSGMIGGRDSGGEYHVISENEAVSDAEEFDGEATVAATISYTPRHTHRAPGGEEAPEGLGDPVDEAERLQAVERVRKALLQLPDIEGRAILCAVYGLNGEPPCSQAQCAASLGIPVRTLERRLAELRTILAELV